MSTFQKAPKAPVVVKVGVDGFYPEAILQPEAKLDVSLLDGCTTNMLDFAIGVEMTEVENSLMCTVLLLYSKDGDFFDTIEFEEMVSFTDKAEVVMSIKDLSTVKTLDTLLGHVLEHTCQVFIGVDGVELRSPAINPPSIYIPMSDELEDKLGLAFKGES